MELTNEFRVDVPVDEAWNVLTDVERIAPCMPGAQLQEIAGDEYRGIVKIKVGPITAQYKGVARFLEKDDDAKKAVLKAEGRDTRGQGNANATITAILTPDGDGTAVSVLTDLTVTGKVAQFGRGVLADVSAKLLTQFATCLQDDLLQSSPAPAGATSPETTPEPVDEAPTAAPATAPAVESAAAAPSTAGTMTAPRATETPVVEQAAADASRDGASGSGSSDEVRKIESKPAAPIDLLDAAGVNRTRAVPIVAGLLLVTWFLFRRRRRR